MSLREHDLEWHAPDQLRIEVLRCRRERDVGDVDAPIPQGLELLRLGTVKILEVHLRVGLAEGANNRSQIIQMDTAWKPERQAARKSPGGSPGLVRGLVCLCQNRTRPPIKSFPRSGELDATVPALKERHLELGFEVLHLAAQGGLSNPQPGGGMRKVELLRHGNKVAQVSQFHPPAIAKTYGATKKQSIGRMSLMELQEKQMSTTRTGSTRTEAAIPEARDTVSDAEASGSAIQTVSEETTILCPVPESSKVNEAATGGQPKGDTPAGQTERSRQEFWPNSRLVKTLTGLVSLVLVGAGLFWWWSIARCWVETDNAYLASHIHSISARVSGTVNEVLVEDNQLVTTGTVLARLDPNDFEVKRQQALAQLDQTRAQLQQAEAQIAQSRSGLAREEVRANKASQDLKRAESLAEGANGAISRQEFDQAKAESDAAQAAVQGAESALKSAEALLSAARAQEEVAQANLREAELQFSYTTITAPAAGRIGRKDLEIGNQVRAGQALLALVQPEVWVTANFKETQLAGLKPGQPVRVRVDAFPGLTFRGRVESISPASGSQFALLPPDNATGNFTKIVQRVPVKIVLEESHLGCEDRMAAGMSAVVEVRIRE